MSPKFISDQCRKAQIRKLKELWADPAWRRRQIRRSKAGLARKKKEARRKIAAWWADPAWRDAIIEARKTAFARPEVKKRMRKAQQERFKRPKELAKIRRQLASMSNDPAIKRKQAASMREHWKDPRNRERIKLASLQGKIKRWIRLVKEK